MTVLDTIGAVEIGVLVSAVLFGVEMMQMYVYFTRFPKDPKKLKYLVRRGTLLCTT